MVKPILVDLFVEDRAHEAFIRALLERLALEHDKTIEIRVRSARGGHGRALKELALYQSSLAKGIGNLTLPDAMVIAIDANCQRLQAARRSIENTLQPGFDACSAIACPDPHIERWYLADTSAFAQAVGIEPKVGKRKCERDRYKAILAQAIVEAGHVPTLGGIEFAPEIVAVMDLYRAGKAEKSLKLFLDQVNPLFKRL